MVLVKVPDSTPGLIVKYALSDEQALLAKARYNRRLVTPETVSEAEVRAYNAGPE